MLESEIKKLTAAVEANTAALTSSAVVVVPAGAPDAQVTTPVVPAAPAPVIPAAPAAAAPIVPAAATPAAAVVAAVGVDKKALTEKFIELAQAKGREVAQQLLAEYGVASLPELKDKAQWPAFFAACDAKIALAP